MFLLSSKITQKILVITLLLLALLTQLPKDQASAQEPSSSSKIIIEDISTPIQTVLSIDSYPRVGQPTKLVCEISSVLDAPGTKAQIELPPNARLLSGDLTWQGDLLPGNPIQFAATIVFDAAGDAAIFCRAHRVIDAENSWGDLAALYLSIGQTSSQKGFAVPAPIERDRLGELAAPGDGQVIAAAAQPAPLRKGQIIELPPSVAPSSASDISAKSNNNEVVTQGTLTVTGRFQFHNRDDNLTSEQFLVEVVRGDNNIHLAWCYTDVSGYYSCGPFTNPGSVGVRARFLSYVNFSPYGDVLVAVNPDWGTTGIPDNAYVGVTTSVQVFADGTHDLGSWNVLNGDSYERAYWITHDLIRVWKYIWYGTGSSQNPQETAGPATVEWKIDSTDGTYYMPGGNIHLTGEDPLSNTVVGHEYAHNIQYTIYGNSLPPAPNCNPHYVILASSSGCAWVEGWANFLPLAVNNDPIFRWPDGAQLNLENPTWGTPNWDEGDAVEGRVAGALWDILDTANENDDQYSDGGIVNIWDTIYHQNDNNFSEYSSAWKSRGHNNTSAGPVMGIYQNTINYRSGPANDDLNNATPIFSVPYLITNLNTTNATTQGQDPNYPCGSINTPKQSRSVWYRYTPTISGSYTLTTNGSNYNTVLAVWTGTFGALANWGCNDDSGGVQSKLVVTLNTGTTYYIEVTNYGSGFGGLLTLNVTFNPPIALAVTPTGFDDIGAVLSRPELGYPWTQIPVTSLANYSLLSQYDVVFINCTWDIQNTPQVINALRQYVQNGGSLYVSDWAYEYIRDAFPGFINFPSYPKIGTAQQVIANITDPGLANYINPSNPPSTIGLNYDLPGWVVINSVSTKTTVHVQGSFNTSSNLAQVSSLDQRQQLATHQELQALGQLTNKPLVVSFWPYGSSGGRVMYTTFHNEALQSTFEKKLLEYLVLNPLTSAQQRAVVQAIAAEGLDLTRTDINTVDQGATSSLFTYPYSKNVTDPRVAFALAWSGSSLKLLVYRPDGSLYQQLQSNQSPIKIIIPDAESGNWKYQVTGISVPYNNYPYVVGVGAELRKVYLPLITKGQ